MLLGLGFYTLGVGLGTVFFEADLALARTDWKNTHINTNKATSLFQRFISKYLKYKLKQIKTKYLNRKIILKISPSNYIKIFYYFLQETRYQCIHKHFGKKLWKALLLKKQIQNLYLDSFIEDVNNNLFLIKSIMCKLTRVASIFQFYLGIYFDIEVVLALFWTCNTLLKALTYNIVTVIALKPSNKSIANS